MNQTSALLSLLIFSACGNDLGAIDDLSENTSVTIELPSRAYSSRIISAEGRILEKRPTSMTLSGGASLPVMDGVEFSKYSSLYFSGAQNLPIWRFALGDNTDGRHTLEFRIELEGEELVGWSSAAEVNGKFEVVVSSELSPVIGLVSGTYDLEVRASDLNGNYSDVERLSWSQTILTPPIFVEAGTELLLNSADEANPAHYRLGESFSSLTDDTAERLAIGVMRIGNPNVLPVQIRLASALDTLVTSLFDDRTVTLESNIIDRISGCGNQRTNADLSGCYEFAEPPFSRVFLSDGPNTLSFQAQTTSGIPLPMIDGDSFIAKPNTEYLVVVSLTQPLDNFPDGLTERVLPTDGGSSRGTTLIENASFYQCVVPTGPETCSLWSFRLNYWSLVKAFGSWSYDLSVESKLVINRAAKAVAGMREIPWLPANETSVSGFSRTLSVAKRSFALPVSHQDEDFRH